MSRVLVKPELLAPAGNMEKGKMALLYGADAIYLGGKAFSLRAFSGNFSIEEIEEITAFAHNLGKKTIIERSANCTIVHNRGSLSWE